MSKFKRVYCKNCNKTIYRSTGRFNENMKLGHNFYCSRKCEYQYKTKKRKLICENCGKIFLRPLNAISPHNYCSQSCAALVNNKKYPKRRNIIMKICEKCGKKFRKSTNNLKYCSLICRRKAEQKSPQEVIKIIKKAFKKLKRIPARRELRGINDSCRKIFGSWNNAVITAGFEPNRSHSNRMYRRIITKAADGHPCDSISEAIIDNWLTKNNISHKRDVSYPGTNHKADWGISVGGKKIFVEYFGLAKDSPRYDRAIRKKKELCRKHKLTLVAIYPQDIYPKKYLDDKLKVKFKNLINF